MYREACPRLTIYDDPNSMSSWIGAVAYAVGSPTDLETLILIA
jgi:hypothetical protein